MLRNLKNALGFLTILPVGMADSLEDLSKKMYIFPLIGGVLGLIAGLIFKITSFVLPPSISSSIGFFSLIFLTGLHHLDGLLDFGDAAIYRGDRKRRIEILRDPHIGAGGFFLGLMFVVLGVLVVNEYASVGGDLMMLFIVSEAAAKASMVFGAGLGKPAFKGTGSVFINAVKSNRQQILYAMIIVLLILWPFLGLMSVVLIIISILNAALLSKISDRLLGGMNGDVFGTLNETTRFIVMLVLLWML